MYLPAQFGDHRSYRNANINSYINSYMDNLEKDHFATSIRHIGRFLKSGIPIYSSEVPDTAGSKARRRGKTHAIAKRYAFHANAIRCICNNSFKTVVVEVDK